MNIKYKDFEIDICMTNADVLEALDKVQELSKSFAGCTSFKEIAAKIRNVGENLKTAVELSGGNFDEMFPKPDMMDYSEFFKAINAAMGKGKTITPINRA